MVRSRTLSQILRYLSLPSLFPIFFLVATMFPISIISSKSTEAVLCPISEYIDDLDKTVTEFFECPGSEGMQLKNHTECVTDLD